MSALQAFAMFMLGAACGAALIFVLLKPAIDQALASKVITAPDHLVRTCIAEIKSLARLKEPNYELPADSFIEDVVWRVIAHVYALQEKQR